MADAGQLERNYALIEKGPTTFVAAFFAMTTFFLLGVLVRVLINQKNEVKELLNAERERAVKQENVSHGFLELVRMGAIALRAGKPRLLKMPGGRVLRGYFLDDADPMAPDAPTGPHRIAGVGSGQD